jgi:lipopolysaccharide transport system permease protein
MVVVLLRTGECHNAVDGDPSTIGHRHLMNNTSAEAPRDAVPTRTIIEPGRGWALHLGELWPYRELLYFFVWRDIKVRYKQTAVGALWAIIQPVALTLVFTLFFGSLRGISPEGIPYALFALSGLVPWTLFSQTLSGCSDSLIQSAQLLQKVYFPRLLLPISTAGTTLLDFAIGMGVLLVVMLVMVGLPAASAIWLVPLTLLAVTVALAVGIWAAAINVRYRDVRYVVPFLIQVWFFATPIIYSVALVPQEVRWLYYLNPMAGVVTGFRWALFAEGAPPLEPILLSMVVTIIVLITGLSYFRHTERGFADVI